MSLFRTKAIRVLSVLAVCASLVGLLSIQTASADPFAATAYVGVGSDTTQDVMNALSGPVRSLPTSGSKSIVSWDALTPAGATGCIFPKYGAKAIDRPVGSSLGITALNNAIDGVPWIAPVGTCTGAATVIGSANLDFARSSRAPASTTTADLTFVPFARDALTYVWRSNSPTAATDLRTLGRANIAAALAPGATGRFTSGGTEVYVCLPQAGSGTRSSWRTAVGITNDTAAGTVASLVDPRCNTTQEHDGDDFNTFATDILATRPNSAVIIPFSVSQYIAQCNGFGTDRSATFRAQVTAGVAGIGDPDSVAAPTGPLTNATTGSCAGNQAYYSFVSAANPLGTYGRDVYNVVRTSRISGLFADPGLREIFTSTTNPNGICGTNIRPIIRNYGFLDPVLPCGNTTLTAES